MAQPFNPYIHNASFNTIVGGNFLLLQKLTEEEVVRANKELLLWKFYKGDQWQNKRVEGEPQITLNYCKAFVNKSVAFLFGKGFTLEVKESAENIVKPFLEKIWDDNKKELLGIEIAQSGGVTGNAWLKIAIEVFDPEENPEQYELYPNGRIRILLLPSYTVFPSWDGHDRDRMTKCRIMYPLIVETTRVTGDVAHERVWYQEVITPTTIQEFYNDELMEERENRLGVIPIVQIKNFPCAEDLFGTSDLESIYPLQRELNNKATDVSDIVNYHAAPVTIVQGAKVANLEKGARKVWGGIPKDGKVYNLELESDLGAAMNYLDFLKSSMFELAHMPEDAFGKETNISNTSGVALHIKNQPLMELTHIKRITYNEGIKKINKLILKCAQVIEHPDLNLEQFNALPVYERYWTNTVFPSPLPKDELIQLQLIIQKISAYLMSRKQALVSLGEIDAAQKFQEILDEARLLQNTVYDDDTEAALSVNVGGIMTNDERIPRIEGDA